MAGLPNLAPDPAFEREKWEADLRLRERELDIKHQEQLTKDAEVQAKIREQERARWFNNPLVLAVLAAAFAGLSNAGVALINGSAQRELEDARSKAQLDLEKYKADAQNSLERNKADGQQSVEEARGEAARILEVIKTADPDKAAINLKFLLDAGLITNEERKNALAEFLFQREPGQGPSLPTSSSSTVSFAQQWPTLACELQEGDGLEEFITKFRKAFEAAPFGFGTEDRGKLHDGRNIWVQRQSVGGVLYRFSMANNATININLLNEKRVGLSDDDLIKSLINNTLDKIPDLEGNAGHDAMIAVGRRILKGIVKNSACITDPILNIARR